MPGIFNLNSAGNLLEKLEWEYQNLLGEKENGYVAYNFFVTAWHLLEWKFPDPDGKEIRKSIKSDSVLLQICDYLAVGAKHFEPCGKRHKSVDKSKKGGVWADDAWAPRVWADGTWATWLEIHLSGEAAEQFGSVIKLEDFASEVMKFWRGFTPPSTK